MNRIACIVVTIATFTVISAASATAIPVPPDAGQSPDKATASVFPSHRDHPGAEHRMPYLFRVGSDSSV